MRYVLWLFVVVHVGCAHPVLSMAEKIPFHAASYEPTSGDSAAKPLADLLARVCSWGMTVEYLEMSAFGRYIRPAHTIQLREGLSVNAQFEVLAHELGHVFAPPAIDDMTGQVFAELVGVEIAKFYGYESKRIAAAYIAQFKHTFSAVKHMRVDLEFAVKAATGQVPVSFKGPQ